MAVSCWRHRLQCIVIVPSFLRLLKLHEPAVGKLDLSRRGLTWCHGVLYHRLNLPRNIPLTRCRQAQFISVFTWQVFNKHYVSNCNKSRKCSGSFNSGTFSKLSKASVKTGLTHAQTACTVVTCLTYHIEAVVFFPTPILITKGTHNDKLKVPLIRQCNPSSAWSGLFSLSVD